MRCRHLNHLTTDIERCETYSIKLNVLIVKSPKYSMSNKFPCRMKMHNIDFPSIAHAYQWRFLQYIDKSDLDEEVLKPLKINLYLHPTIVRKMVQLNTKQRLCLISICSNGSCSLTRRLTRPRIMSMLLGMMTTYHSNSITVVRVIMVLDIGFIVK